MLTLVGRIVIFVMRVGRDFLDFSLTWIIRFDAMRSDFAVVSSLQ